MRPDMHEVLIERPRRGARFKTRRNNKPRVTEWDGEDGYGRDYRPNPLRTKYFDDFLQPLKRWLRRQVGRPWDKVWSELCAGIDARSTVGKHLMDHARLEVEQTCRLDADGKPVMLSGRNRLRRLGWIRPEGLYVHPRTGLLCFRPEIDRYGWPEHSDDSPDTQLRHDGHFLRKLGGVWYDVEARAAGPRDLDYDFRWNHVGYFAASKRQLSTRELRDLGLANDAPD